MAAPTATDLLGLKFQLEGLPLVTVADNASLAGTLMQVDGLPCFVLVNIGSGGAVTPPDPGTGSAGPTLFFLMF